MLGSAHDGERAAAALHANRLLGELGVTWYELLDNDTGSYQAGYDQGFQDAAEKAYELQKDKEEEIANLRQQMVHGSPWQTVGSTHDYQRNATECLASAVRWTPWEHGFLEDMQFRHTISEKQAAIVSKLYAKMRYYQARRSKQS